MPFEKPCGVCGVPSLFRFKKKSGEEVGLCNGMSCLRALEEGDTVQTAEPANRREQSSPPAVAGARWLRRLVHRLFPDRRNP
jgi:hypothetical protein